MANGLNGLAFSNIGTLYASVLAPGFANSSLYTINPSTGASTLIGVITTAIVTDLAIDPSGSLFAWDLTDGGLMTVNTTTGAGTLVGLTGQPQITGLTFDPSGNLFGGFSSLYSVNKATGSTTLIGPLGSNVYGLAFAVPEPSSLLLSLGGFVLIGALTLRVRRPTSSRSQIN
jgi:hypothetical protein